MALNEKMKNFLSLFLRVGISGVLLFFLFSKMDKAKMVETFKIADYSYMFYAGIVFLFIHAVILLRWVILVRALDLAIPVITVVKYFFIGLFFNLCLPTSTGGDFVKVYELCKLTPSKAKVVASVVMDRLTGFIAMVIIASTAFSFGYKYIQDMFLVIFIGLLACLSFGLIILLFNEKVFVFVVRVFNRLPKVKDALMSLQRDISLYKERKGALIQSVGLSCLSQILLALVYFLLARCLHQNIQFFYFLIFIPLLCVVSSLPSIGGLGVRDFGAAKLFGMIGVVEEISTGMTLINFFFMVLIGLFGGLLYVIKLSPRRVQHHQARAHVSPKGA